MNDNQILDYLKTKYMPKTPVSDPKNEDSNKKDKISNDSEYNGEEAENKFLVGKLERVQVELTKWLDILKLKIHNTL